MTILEFEDGSTRFARRGLQKFFDLQIEESNSTEYRETLGRPIKYVSEGIQVVKCLKANGENLQVAYVKELDSWMICSKNVSLILNNIFEIETVIEHYRKQIKDSS